VAQKLITSGVVAVVGHKDSGVSIPASAVYNAADIVQITPTSSNPTLTQHGFDTVFRVCPIDTTQGPLLAEFMAQKLGYKKIAILHADTAYGQGLAAEYDRRIKELNVTPVANIEIKRGDKDFSQALSQVQPLAPEAIFYAGSLPEAIIIVNQMKEMGIKAVFVGGDTLFQPDFIRQTGTAAEGDYVSSFFPNTSQDSSQDVRNWIGQYRDEFKRNPGGNSSGGYVAAQAIFTAIKNANSTDPAQIKAALKKVDMQSMIGRIAFDNKGDLQDQRAHLHIFQIKDGVFTPVNP
jgi:branched-chain amino acid transport system substrate-binding protein